MFFMGAQWCPFCAVRALGAGSRRPPASGSGAASANCSAARARTTSRPWRPTTSPGRPTRATTSASATRGGHRGRRPAAEARLLRRTAGGRIRQARLRSRSSSPPARAGRYTVDLGYSPGLIDGQTFADAAQGSRHRSADRGGRSDRRPGRRDHRADLQARREAAGERLREGIDPGARSGTRMSGVGTAARLVFRDPFNLALGLVAALGCAVLLCWSGQIVTRAPLGGPLLGPRHRAPGRDRRDQPRLRDRRAAAAGRRPPGPRRRPPARRGGLRPRLALRDRRRLLLLAPDPADDPRLPRRHRHLDPRRQPRHPPLVPAA